MYVGQIILFVCTLVHMSVAQSEWYPLLKKEEIKSPLVPFVRGTKMPLECMIRNIDNGEHKMDANKDILFSPFPTCKETGKPLTLLYGLNEDISCTIALTDELYHLFQLYIHEDAPFSCRLPISNEADAASHGLTVPLVFNIRGTLSESHIHVDNNINILNLKPAKYNTLVSSTAFSSGTNVTRAIIGDYLTLNFAVRWLEVDVEDDGQEYHYPGGFYKLPLRMNQSLSGIGLYLLITAAISAAATYSVLYVRFNKKNLANPAFEFDNLNKRD